METIMKIKCKKCNSRVNSTNIICSDPNCTLKFPHTELALDFSDIKNEPKPELQLVETIQSPESQPIPIVHFDSEQDIWDAIGGNGPYKNTLF